MVTQVEVPLLQPSFGWLALPLVWCLVRFPRGLPYHEKSEKVSGGFEKKGSLIWGSYSKEHRILGSIMGLPVSGIPHLAEHQA